MAITAKADPGTHLFTGGQTFDFGEDGTRQVTEAERALLERHNENGGVPKIEFSETKSKKVKE